MRKTLLSILVSSVLMISTSVGCGCSSSRLTILSIAEGNVFVTKAGTDNWIEAEVGMSLKPGDSIKTGDDSSAEVTFFEGSTIELEGGTEIEIAILDISASTGSTTVTVEQTIGSIIFRVTKIIDPASRHEVETPVGVVAVRGSAVEIHVAEDGTTRAANLEGEIWAAAQGVELRVPQGQQCIISPGEQPKISSFVQMTTGDVDSLDPAWAYDVISCEQVQYIYETLLFYEGEEVDEFVPMLATEWEWDDADVAWRFKIREGVKFHEGGDLTPSDVEYSFERALVQDRHDDGPGPIWMLYQPLLGLNSSRGDDLVGEIVIDFDQIDNAVEVDGDSIVFYLVDSTWRQRFLLILCGTWASIVDKEWCVANDEWDGTERTWRGYNEPGRADDYLYNHANGTGPWKLEEWDMGVQIEVVRNDAYWREPAAFETVTTQFVEDWTTRREALLRGDADLIYTTSPSRYDELEGIEELEGIADLNVYKDLPGFAAHAFSFNMDIASDSSYIGSGQLDGEGIPTDFFSDTDVRKGFCYAFDYETYIEDGWAGQAQQLGSPVIEGLPFYDPDASAYSLDLGKAEEHLRAAWSGEVWEKGFKFTLGYDADLLPPQETACRILAENLLAMNPKFQISIQSMDFWTAQVPNMRSRVLPMFWAPWGGDWPHPNNFVVPFMASYGVFAGWQSYGNSELDELIENALREPNPTVQQYLYYAIQERYYEDAPSTALVQPLGRRYFTKYIHGFYYNPMIAGRAGPLYYMSKSES